MIARYRGLGRLAWRESRTARRRLFLYMSSIAIGVAALVAIDSFAGNVTRSIREQSRALLGGDIAFSARQAFPARADSLLDSLQANGVPIARVTSFASMAVVPRTERTRLAQVRAVSDDYPFYGNIITDPAGQWQSLREGANVLVDPSLLLSLDGQVGDTLTLGQARFRITGVLRSVPGDPGIASAIAPRIFIADRYVAETQLIVLGSRAEYEVVARLPEGVSPDDAARPMRARLEGSGVRIRTVTQSELSLTDAVDDLGDFLGLVGLVALLLGGIGVASGVHAFVARKIDTVAVLRCVGATSGQVLAIYATQAALMGLAGAAVGAALGVAVQFALPHVMMDVLPVNVSVRLEPTAIFMGLGIGLWVALVFALRPLLALRTISPLQALRRTADPSVLRPVWHDWRRLTVDTLIVLTVLGIAWSRAGSLAAGAGMAGAVAFVLLCLWFAAALLSRVARAVLRTHWPYVLRQGVANLSRPGNQTRSVVLALGFGAFLITTLYLVQQNLLAKFESTAAQSRANVLFFDVQDDQLSPLDSMMRSSGAEVMLTAPIITMRIAAINGVKVATLTADTARAGWALRREYRSTFRDGMVPTEELVSGRWFGDPGAGKGEGVPQLSLEEDVARDLGVVLGDTVTWNVQGIDVETRVTSLRRVNWAQFEPNFFAVFEPRALAGAPLQYVILAHAEGDSLAAGVQQQAVRLFPNVASIDLSLVRETIAEVVGKVRAAVQFLALFSLAMAIPVLMSAVAATQRERLRDGVLLKTLGATRRQIRRILLAEYALLGVLGSLTGVLLAFGGAWGVMRWVFHSPFAPVYWPVVAIGAVMIALAVSIGLVGGRDVLNEPPLAALREA